MDDSGQRLAQLTRILNDGHAHAGASATEPVELHLRSVRADRIRQLTRQIEERIGHETDELDRVAMRLLLDEYASAVAHLRAVARDGATRIDKAPAALKDVRRYVNQQLELEQPRPASTAPSDR